MLNPFTRSLACVAACATLLAIGLSAHEAKYRHAHGGSSLPPDYESFGVVWYQDIQYSSAPNTEPALLSLDIHTLGQSALPNEPPAPTNAPVLVYVHGGGGIRGDKSFSADLAVKPAYFLKREGFIFVSVNYRLGEAGRYPVAAQDVANAIAWVHNNIAQFGGNPDRMFLAGHSSGGALVATVATIDRFLKTAGKDRAIVKGAITIDSGGLDILAGAETEPVQQRLMKTYGPTRADWEAASPIHNVGKGRYVPPFLLMHIGSATTRTGRLGGTRSDAEALATALRAGGHRAELVELAGKDHNEATAHLGLVNDPATRAVHDFLATLSGKTSSQ
jgi:acetyl esterase/lipase